MNISSTVIGACVSLCLCLTQAACSSSSGEEQAGGDTSEKVITTKSGLRYVEVKEGAGDVARAGDTVEVHYTGKLKDGTKFDSSLDRNKPIQFRLGTGMVIKGWDEGIAGMKVGGKRKLMIPPELGYGSRAVGPIPANSELFFDVELVKVKK